MPVVSSVRTDRPYVALTFDDGPLEPETDSLLDALADAGARATFFVRGSAISDATRRMVERAATEGHDVGNHTHSHYALDECTNDTLREEVRRTHDDLTAILGEAPTLIRPPYGRDPERVDAEAVKLGYRATVLWSIEAADWEMPPAEVIARRVLESPALRGGAIVLLHDGYSPAQGKQSRRPTVDAVVQLLPELKRRGFEMVGVSRLLDAGGV
jgi:peptidoglycan/xylan/chitin deacetylase (PgdA/CDA1 family)